MGKILDAVLHLLGFRMHIPDLALTLLLLWVSFTMTKSESLFHYTAFLTFKCFCYEHFNVTILLLSYAYL